MEPANRPLLVLDLDETLWHGKESPAGVLFTIRPYAGEFLWKVSKHYDLAVWTSATESWMQAGLQALHRETGFDLVAHAFFLWDRSRTTLRRTEQGTYAWRKPARKFRARWIRERYPRERILVVDDQPENYACGYGHLVRVHEWMGDQADDELSRLVPFLIHIAEETDLRRIEKRGWRASYFPDPPLTTQ